MKKRFACGHLGKGQWCHRCAYAQNLEALAAYPADNRRERRAREMSADAIRAEVSRLRSVPGRSSPAAAGPTSPTLESLL